MAWEWVGPVVAGVTGGLGIFFTWLTGWQGRKQADETSRRQDEKAERERITQERRDAYFAALELASIDLRRARYKREGEDAKLAEIEQKWSKQKRVEMEFQTKTRVEVYGSPEAREFLRRFSTANDSGDEQGSQRIYADGLALVRRELGTDFFESRAEQ